MQSAHSSGKQIYSNSPFFIVFVCLFERMFISHFVQFTMYTKIVESVVLSFLFFFFCVAYVKAKRYLDPSTIFHTDIDEAMQRITHTVQTLKHFRSLFDKYKEKLDTYFIPNQRSVKFIWHAVNFHIIGTIFFLSVSLCNINPQVLFWTFHPNAVFERFNAFLERLNTIQWFFSTVIEFLKLEKVEIGGLKGRHFELQNYHHFHRFQSTLFIVCR